MIRNTFVDSKKIKFSGNFWHKIEIFEKINRKTGKFDKTKEIHENKKKWSFFFISKISISHHFVCVCLHYAMSVLNNENNKIEIFWLEKEILI